jgi:F-type H+-transporting ATPase subunit b
MENLLKTLDLVPRDVIMIVLWAFLFYGFILLMRRFFFGPYLKLIEARESATEGTSADAAAKQAEAQRMLEEFENRILEARVALTKEKLESLSKAKQEVAASIESAESEAAAYILRNREEIARRMEALRRETFNDADKMAEDLAGKLLQPSAN